MKELTKKDNIILYDIINYQFFEALKTSNLLLLLLILNRKGIYITFINNEYLNVVYEGLTYSLKFKDLLNPRLDAEDNLRLSLYMNMFSSENSLESEYPIFKKYTNIYEYVVSTDDKRTYFFQKYNKNGQLVAIKELAALGSYKELELYTFIEKLIQE